EVYQKAVELAEVIFKITAELPRGQAPLADQFKRASMSISLNIAEGNGRWHAKDRKNFFLIARGSVFECVPLLELCVRQKLISEDQYTTLRVNLESLAKMLSALIKGTDEKREH
ncbi:MAG: four helix bundle protein, partial [Nitrospira sp.]|nr:four helix bundle protein [Nitrospira sp.]